MKTRRKLTKEFKISVLHEHENGKNAAQICREHGVHPLNVIKMEWEYKDNPETAFRCNGNNCRLDAKLSESERLIGQLYAENAFLKKVLSSLETKLLEHRKQKEVS